MNKKCKKLNNDMKHNKNKMKKSQEIYRKNHKNEDMLSFTASTQINLVLIDYICGH